MYYTIQIYGDEATFERLSEEQQQSVMQGHKALQTELAKRGPFASARLMASSTAVTIEPVAEFGGDGPVTDGPFSDTKEQFLGFYGAEFADLEEAIRYARHIATPYVRLEVRPVYWAGGVLAAKDDGADVA